MRGRLRKAAAAAAAVLLLAALAACGSDDTSGDGGEGGDGGTVELTYWTHTHPPMIELNKKLIAEYEAKHPNVKISYEQIPNTEFGTKMLTALSNRSGPDIINMDDSALRGEYIPKDLLAPIDPAGFGKGSVEEIEAGYVPGTLDGAKGKDGQLYGVPSEFNATAFAINKKHFADAGLDPASPPETWDDVAEMGRKLVANGHEGFNFVYLHSGWYSQQLQTLLNETGGSILTEDGTQAAFNSPEGVEALEVLVGMAVEDESVFLDIQNSPYTGLFNSGKIGMLVTGPWDLSSFPDVDYGVEILPGFDGDHQTIAGPDMWTVFDNGGGRAPAALDFIAWLTAADQMKADALATGHLPFRLSVIEDAGFIEEFGAAFPGVDVFAENLANVEQARPVLAAYPQVSEAMGFAIVSAMLGESDAQSALDEAAAQANDALALAG